MTCESLSVALVLILLVAEVYNSTQQCFA